MRPMAEYRKAMPALGGRFFMTDGGIETTLIFLEGEELPHFAAFRLLETPEGRGSLRKYFQTYAELARKFCTGLVLETPTWRASPDWGQKLGYGPDAVAEANREGVRLLEEIRNAYETPETPIVISGCVGPRGDGYVPDSAMSPDDAVAYHRLQIETFANSAADLVTAITMTYADEAVGVARAAREVDMPVVISFTVETDGKLPTGQSLEAAIEQVDGETSGYPAYFMINCAHPTHFEGAVRGDEPWAERIHGLRANASRMSHAELDRASDLDAGNPTELGREYAELRKHRLKRLNVMGGCCGTDHRHIEQIALACLPLFREAT
jgi:S-methylmethionine-dependent homocysteine/selenocysteine methylase